MQARCLVGCEGCLATAECDGRGGLEGKEVRTWRVGASDVGEAFPGEERGAEGVLGSVGGVIGDEAATAGIGEVLVVEQTEASREGPCRGVEAGVERECAGGARSQREAGGRDGEDRPRGP